MLIMYLQMFNVYKKNLPHVHECTTSVWKTRHVLKKRQRKKPINENLLKHIKMKVKNTHKVLELFKLST